MSVLEKIKALDAQKAQLLDQAKTEALNAVNKGLADLTELGFHYQLVEQGKPARTAQTGTRRAGIRNDVLNLIGEHSDGISRAQVLETMDAKGNKQAEQSISNALANLKKAGTINLKDGLYTVA